jgi:osmotically-inducible protein OsmY
MVNDLAGVRRRSGRRPATCRVDQRVYTARIKVTAEHGGVIHLTGIVASNDDLNQARRDAESLAGVRAVVDDLHIEERAGG